MSKRERRFKLVYISESVLTKCVLTNYLRAYHGAEYITVPRLKGEAEGAEVVRVGYDFTRAAFCAILYRKDWPIVPIGYEIPILIINYELISLEVCKPRKGGSKVRMGE